LRKLGKLNLGILIVGTERVGVLISGAFTLGSFGFGTATFGISGLLKVGNLKFGSLILTDESLIAGIFIEIFGREIDGKFKAGFLKPMLKRGRVGFFLLLSELNISFSTTLCFWDGKSFLKIAKTVLINFQIAPKIKRTTSPIKIKNLAITISISCKMTIFFNEQPE
jgi:hypothetical protein